VSVDLITNAHHVNYVGRYRASHASQSLFETSFLRKLVARKMSICHFSRGKLFGGATSFSRDLCRVRQFFPNRRVFFVVT
jgi:hypothetical protein